VAGPSTSFGAKYAPNFAQDDRFGVVLGEQDGFAFQGDVEFLLDAVDDFGFEVFDVGECGLTSIDQGEGVAGGDAGWACAVALDEAGVLKEPGGGEFDLGFWIVRTVDVCRPVGDFFGGEIGGGCDGRELGGGDYGVFEKGASAAGVGVSWVDDHTLGAADVADGVGDFG